MASGRLILPIAEPVLGSTGLVTPGATLSVYTNGATSGTLASLFSDSALTVPIANPQTSDAAGRFYDQTTVIWANANMAYGAVLVIPGGGTLTYENIYTLGAQADISGLAPINSPVFTGVPQAPTPALNDNSAKIATTAYVQGQNYAPLASPAFTGVPTAPTAVAATSNTQIATTAFVHSLLSTTVGTDISITLPGGVILKLGKTSNPIVNPDGSPINVSFASAFPNTIGGAVCIGLVPASGVGGNDVWANIDNTSFTTSGFRAVINGSGSSGANQISGVTWVAWGT
jgi:hypothetical protein